MQSRMNAKNTASLVSSVHLVCRPRCDEEVGEWKDIIDSLPEKISLWMKRLIELNIVGADAIFSCIGPALELFSKFSYVEKANGDIVSINEYLEFVWASVSKEALSTIFNDVDTGSYEPDARLTAIWLWTVLSNTEESSGNDEIEIDEDFTLEGLSLNYDTARKISQGLGIHLDKLNNVVEIKGKKARLFSVKERSNYLLKTNVIHSGMKEKNRTKQLTLFGNLSSEEIKQENLDADSIEIGNTTLDKLHQCMLFFAQGRNDLLKKHLIEENYGNIPHFWKLAQALSALYPRGTEEKRWIDGVLARKKGLGF